MHSEGCRNRMKEISREKDLERYNAALERNMEWMSKSKRVEENSKMEQPE